MRCLKSYFLTRNSSDFRPDRVSSQRLCGWRGVTHPARLISVRSLFMMEVSSNAIRPWLGIVSLRHSVSKVDMLVPGGIQQTSWCLFWENRFLKDDIASCKTAAGVLIICFVVASCSGRETGLEWVDRVVFHMGDDPDTSAGTAFLSVEEKQKLGGIWIFRIFTVDHQHVINIRSGHVVCSVSERMTT